jgi:hypothetical protein
MLFKGAPAVFTLATIGCMATASVEVPAGSAAGAQATSSAEQTSGTNSSSGQAGASATRSRTGGVSFREPDPVDFEDHAGYVQLFDGKSLQGWDGDPSIWRVEEGAIVGESTLDKPSGNSYITYRGFTGKDFDLKLEIKVEKGGGSGIQYRSKTGVSWLALRPGQPQPNLNWMDTGLQADFWYPVSPRTSTFTGQIYSENTPLRIIAWRGQVVHMDSGKPPRLVANIADREALGGYVRINDWNQYLVIARGGTLVHILNGHLMAVLVDDDPNSPNNVSGQVGIEIEGAPSKVSVRNIWVKKY